MSRKSITEEFKSAIFCGTTSYYIKCQLCERFHFCNNPETNDDEYPDQECLDKLISRRKSEVDKFIEWDEPVPYGIVNDKHVVIGCPCNDNELKSFEIFIWDNRYFISEYLIKRSANILGSTEHETDVMGGLKLVIEALDKLNYKRVVKREDINGMESD